MAKRTETTHILVHHSATHPGQDWGAKEIRKIHVGEFGWDDVGYHAILRRNGKIEQGRSDDEVGAHCKPVNKKSIAICLIGGINKHGHAECNFTEAQFKSLEKWLRKQCKRWPAAKVVGHKDIEPRRKPVCPPFSVTQFVEERGI